jgi:two-component system, NtrC family, nitrogen regulation response regulator GlnG
MTAKTVLLADDDSAIRTVLTQALSRAGFSVRSTATATALWRWVSEGQGDVVVTDVVLPDENAFDVIPRIKKLRSNLPIIVMSAQNTMMTAITAAERGAYDYLPKPFDLSVLVQTVSKALEHSARPANAATRTNGADETLPIVGRSPAMQDIYRVIARLTQTDLTVLIVGESGTGKELVARALHNYGKRRKGAFVAVNMAAIPRELIESELFGHEKGAFTGATARMAGRFEQAEGGTLFLDEIGDMPLEAQTRLLRVLQQGEYTSVGGVAPIKSNVRIIAATHRDLRQLIASGQFREDLFFRLNVVPLQVPSLRERLEDLPDLVLHFLNCAAEEGLPRKDMTPEAMAALRVHRWPGNVRELENLIKRLIAMEADDTISASSVTRELTDTPQPVKQDREAEGPADFFEQYLTNYFASFGGTLPPPGLYERLLAEIEPPLLRACLAATHGNQLRAADLLGINRNTLRSKLRNRSIRNMRLMS